MAEMKIVAVKCYKEDPAVFTHYLNLPIEADRVFNNEIPKIYRYVIEAAFKKTDCKGWVYEIVDMNKE